MNIEMKIKAEELHDHIQFQNRQNHKTKRLKGKSMVTHNLNSLHFLATIHYDTQRYKLEYEKTVSYTHLTLPTKLEV